MEYTFFSQDGEPRDVSLSDEAFEKLAKSDFSKIGGDSVETPFVIDGEQVTLPVVRLSMETRHLLTQVMLYLIAKESVVATQRIREGASREYSTSFAGNMKSYQEILECLENSGYQFLQRVPGVVAEALTPI